MKRTVRHQPKHLRRGRRTAARHAAPGKNGDKGLARLVVCAAIFVLLVAVKLLFPQTVSNLAQAAGRLIGRNADFQAAFAAVGRAISGEEDMGSSLQEAYTAVFNPTDSAQDSDAVPSYTAAEEVSVSSVGSDVPSLQKPLRPLAVSVNAQDAEKAPAAEPARTEEQEQEQEQGEEQGEEEEPTDDAMATQALSYVYSMPALPENASLELRRLGFPYTTPLHGTLTSPSAGGSILLTGRKSSTTAWIWPPIRGRTFAPLPTGSSMPPGRAARWATISCWSTPADISPSTPTAAASP